MTIANKIEKLKVFLSSSWQDLQVERETVRESLSRMGVSFIGMELFGSTPSTPLNECIRRVKSADVFVLIVAHRYGALAPARTVSFTELEYLEAYKKGIPCFVYIKDDQTLVRPTFVEQDANGVEKLQRLKNTLKRNHVVSWFSKPEDLAQKVTADLHKFIIDNIIKEWSVKKRKVSLSEVIPEDMLELSYLE